jgi:hypothetical protein
MPTKGFTDPGTRRVSFYDPDVSTGYASSSLWRSCPLLEYMYDPSIGTLLDFQGNSYDAAATTGDFVLTQATAGTAAMSTTEQGTLLVNAGSTTSTHGANVQRPKSMFIPAAGKHIWAEFNVSYTGVTNLNVETAVGLAEIDTTVIGSSAVSTVNHILFESVTDDGILLFNSMKASTGNTPAAAHTIVSGTKVRLGFYVDGVTSVQAYVNGVATGSAVATANVPIVALYPTFVCQSGGTDSPVLAVHGFRIFQLR